MVIDLQNFGMRNADVSTSCSSNMIMPEEGALAENVPGPSAVPWGPQNLSAMKMPWPVLLGSNGTNGTVTPQKYARNLLFLGVNGKQLQRSIHASQFRKDCKRYLLLSDDMNKAGLGMSAKIIQLALLLAMRDNRVLMEHKSNRRWCTRPPYNLRCFYEPWTHCKYPPANASIPNARMRPGLVQLRRNSRTDWHVNYTTTDLAWVKASYLHQHGSFFWSKASFLRYNKSLVAQFLFRPRQWVRRIAECHMLKHSLRPNNFVGVHVRYSPEKALELKQLGLLQPPVSAYSNLTATVAGLLGTSHVFLQTASAHVVGEMRLHAARSSLNVSLTDNARSERDMWPFGQSSKKAVYEEGLIAVVNAHIASYAAAFISITTSMWTQFQLWSTGDPSLLGHITCPAQGIPRSAEILVAIAGSSRPMFTPEERRAWLLAMRQSITCNGKVMIPTVSDAGTPARRMEKLPRSEAIGAAANSSDHHARSKCAYAPGVVELPWALKNATGQICEVARRPSQVAAVQSWLTFAAKANGAHPSDPNTSQRAAVSSFTCGGGCVEYIEPLHGFGRHPHAAVGCGQLGTLKDAAGHSWRVTPISKYRTDYLILPNRCTGSSGSGGGSCGVRSGRNLLFDLGCGEYGSGNVDVTKLGTGGRDPSIPLFIAMFERNCINFDAIWGWEARQFEPRKWWMHVPQRVRERLTFINEPVNLTSASALGVLQTKARREDYVVLKIDIDAPELEQAIVSRILETPELARLIDELFFEYHYYAPEMKMLRANVKMTRGSHERVDRAIARMQALRRLGIRSHFWV